MHAWTMLFPKKHALLNKQTKNNLCQAWNTSLQVYDQGSQRPPNTTCCHCPGCLLLLDNKTLTVMTQHTLVE